MCNLFTIYNKYIFSAQLNEFLQSIYPHSHHPSQDVKQEPPQKGFLVSITRQPSSKTT